MLACDAAVAVGNVLQDPEFRRHFQKMTAQIGVDPLASSKGFWAEVLGVSDFYYELAVQIVDVCLATRPINGGLLDLAELQVRLERMRGSRAQAIGEDDIVRAVGKLKLLGGGYDLRNVGARKMIVSVPYELNPDHATVLQLASSSGGFVTDGSLAEAARWPEPRRVRVLQSLLKEGMAWVDDQAPAPADARLTPAQRRRYYFPAAMGGGARGGEASPVAGGAGGAGS